MESGVGGVGVSGARSGLIHPVALGVRLQRALLNMIVRGHNLPIKMT